MKTKKIKYHVTHSFVEVETDVKHSFITQLYQVGVYGILDNNPSYQFNLTPQQIVKIEKRLKKQLENGEIKDLEFGREITVTDESGFWVKI